MTTKFPLQGSCVENPFDTLNTLDTIINTAEEITSQEFVSNSDIEGETAIDVLQYPHSLNQYTQKPKS